MLSKAIRSGLSAGRVSISSCVMTPSCRNVLSLVAVSCHCWRSCSRVAWRSATSPWTPCVIASAWACVMVPSATRSDRTLFRTSSAAPLKPSGPWPCSFGAGVAPESVEAGVPAGSVGLAPWRAACARSRTVGAAVATAAPAMSRKPATGSQMNLRMKVLRFSLLSSRCHLDRARPASRAGLGILQRRPVNGLRSAGTNALLLADEHYAVAQRQQDAFDSVVGRDEVVELARRHGGLAAIGLVQHGAVTQHVVDGDQPAGPHEPQRLLVVRTVRRLVRVDEGEIERGLELLERLAGRTHD